MAGPPDEPVGDPPEDPHWRGPATLLDEDLVDREIRSRLRARILGDEHRPLYVGRFRLLRKLGEGGMGTVHAAYDEALEREVAIKLLHPSQRHDEQATQRMRREATALAQLSHPNLVPIFEVGEFEGQVFLAMELVPGVTMDQWVHQRQRAWAAVLGHWLDVARALVVMHEARLIHRDIKPSNVLVGPDARARLVDFGLARGHAGDEECAMSSIELDAEPEEPDSGHERLQQLITRSGVPAGTPAYMAPEVRRGEVAGPRADQYSLCVSIYESLYGRRPPPVARDGTLVGVPSTLPIPIVVRRALTRGLAPNPRDRFADVRTLTRALERATSQRGRRFALVGVGVAVLVAAVGGGMVTRALGPSAPTSVDPCAAIDDDLDGVWDLPQREALHAAIVATDVPYATRVLEPLDRRLQAHATAWLGARRRACEATRVEHVQSETLLDRRMACLDDQRRSLAALLEAAPAALTAERLPRLPLMLAELRDPAECLADTLVSTAPPPPPAAAHEEVEALRSTIAALHQRALLAGPKDTLASAEEVLAHAERIGYGPLLAEVSLVLGTLHQLADDPRARPFLERAANLGEALDHIAVKEEALRQLVRLAIDVELDAKAARQLLDRDLAVIQRLGSPPRALALATGLRAALATMEDDHVVAEAELRAAIGQWEAQGERQAPALATTLRDLGNLLVGRGRLDEATLLFARAQRLDATWGGMTLETLLGSTLRGHGELVRGLAATRAGHFDEAASWLARARRECVAGYGEQSVPVGRVEVALADLALRRGRLEDVLDHANAADTCFRRWLGDDHQLRASALAAVGTVAFRLGQAQRSVDAFSEELRLSLSVLPPHGVRVSVARSNLGEALVLAGRNDEARPLLELALADLERALPPTDGLLSFPAHALGELAWQRRQLDNAHDYAQRALTIRERHADDPIELARTRWLLAQVQRARGQPAQARELAEAARAALAALGPMFAAQAQQIDDWLRAAP